MHPHARQEAHDAERTVVRYPCEYELAIAVGHVTTSIASDRRSAAMGSCQLSAKPCGNLKCPLSFPVETPLRFYIRTHTEASLTGSAELPRLPWTDLLCLDRPREANSGRNIRFFSL